MSERPQYIPISAYVQRPAPLPVRVVGPRAWTEADLDALERLGLDLSHLTYARWLVAKGRVSEWPPEPAPIQCADDRGDVSDWALMGFGLIAVAGLWLALALTPQGF